MESTANSQRTHSAEDRVTPRSVRVSHPWSELLSWAKTMRWVMERVSIIGVGACFNVWALMAFQKISQPREARQRRRGSRPAAGPHLLHGLGPRNVLPPAR